MADFLISLKYVIQNEGVGYETYPETDQPTNTGIIMADVAEFRNVPLSEITSNVVKNLTQGEIQEIYKALYWDKLSCDQINNQNIATCIFDITVNRGLGIGPKYAQRVCNLLGSSLVVDGSIGPKTISSINDCEEKDFINHLVTIELAGYEAIIASHPTDQRYWNGWKNRAERMLTLIN